MQSFLGQSQKNTYYQKLDISFVDCIAAVNSGLGAVKSSYFVLTDSSEIWTIQTSLYFHQELTLSETCDLKYSCLLELSWWTRKSFSAGLASHWCELQEYKWILCPLLFKEKNRFMANNLKKKFAKERRCSFSFWIVTTG